MPELLNIVETTVLDKLGEDVAVIDMQGVNPFTDAFVICTAKNTQHADGIAEAVMDEATKAGFDPRCKEGDRNSNWVLVDLNGIILHVFTENARNTYRLENLWGDRPVKYVES